MAFVRWRKNCAELLATVYADGRSRQVLLTSLPGPYVPMHLRNEVSRRFPDIPVDWHAVQKALARGPKAHPAPTHHMTWAEAESLLRELAWSLATPRGWTRDALALERAADVLTQWRFGNIALEDPAGHGTLSSDDHKDPALRGPPEGECPSLCRIDG